MIVLIYLLEDGQYLGYELKDSIDNSTLLEGSSYYFDGDFYNIESVTFNDHYDFETELYEIILSRDLRED